MTKSRLDTALVGRGLASGREKAKAMIQAGMVLVDGKRAGKPAMLISEDAGIQVEGELPPYVSRGGLKLEKAILAHGLDLTGMVCGDIGASSGGFSDCMLQHGAEKIYAVDVGSGQLAEKLRTDPRVVNLEGTNARYLTEEQIPEPLDFCSIDVSFISLTLVLPVLQRLLRAGGQGVCLVKPQFEAGKGNVGKKGVVRDQRLHLEVLQRLYRFCGELGFCLKGAHYSPVKGPEGNIEYLFFFEKSPEPATVKEGELKKLVEESHRNLD